MEISAVKLTDLLQNVKDVIKGTFSKPVWVIAEISEISVNFAGHCFIELIEKQDYSETISAKIRATVWASVYRMLSPYFETVTGSELQKGMKILVKVYAEFNEVYGLSLNITDIEPNFTIGEQERLRRDIIKQLESDGVIDMNSMIELPHVIQSIAILSSPSAAGYGDFLSQLDGNVYGYKFNCKLFPCIMQGQKTAESIISNLEKIFELEHLFDAVVIVRGGGSKSDLAWFDNYELALNISQFPLPVISGIGHDRDTSIVDMVAHTHLKTPTAVAGWLVNHNAMFEQNVLEYAKSIVQNVNDVIDANEQLFSKIYNTLSPIVLSHTTRENILLNKMVFNIQKNYHNIAINAKQHIKSRTMAAFGKTEIQILKQQQILKNINSDSSYFVKNILADSEKNLSSIETISFMLDPQRVLDRGYSITMDKNGKLLRSVKALKKGMNVKNRLSDGMFESEIL